MQDLRETNPQSGATILVAEDEKVVRDLILAILRSAGWNVITAADGEEALKIYEENEERIDLVLSDLVMPRLGGQELFGILRARKPTLRFLFMSGYGDSEFSEGFVHAASLDLIYKPFTRNDLTSKIQELLDR